MDKATEDKILSYLIVLDDFEETIDSFKSLDDDLSSIYDDSEEEDEKEKETSTQEESTTENNANEKEKIINKLDKAQKKTKEYVKKAQEEYSNTSKSLAVIMLRVANIAKLVQKLTDMTTYIAQINKVLSGLKQEALNNQYAQYLKLNVELVELKIKRELKICYKKTNKYTTKYLSLFLNGKCCSALSTTYGALLMSLQVVVAAIQIALDAIQKGISCIPKNFTIGGEGLSFFITPKYFTGGITMPIYNMNSSMILYMAQGLTESISELLHTPTKSNAALKSAFLAARVAAAQSQLQVSGLNPEVPEVNIQNTISTLYNAVDALLALLPSPQPLPKYEKLNMFTNVGFSMWLMTGWCRAGQVAFGLMGQLPGVPA